MEIFRTGEKVRVIKGYPDWLTVGDILTVESGNEHDGSNVVCVTTTDNRVGGFIIDDHHFERIEPVTTTTKSETAPTNILKLEDGKYGDLTVRGGSVLKGTKLVVQPFGKQIFIDVSARNSSNTATHGFLDGVAAAALKLGLGVRYVDNLKTFFDPKARYAEFVKSGDTQGVELSDEEKNALKLIEGIKSKFDAAFTLPTPPKAPYVKVDLPRNVRNPLSSVTVSGGSVRRSGYSLPIAEVKKLWEDAREFWRSGKSSGELSGRRFSGDRYRTPRITAKSVAIGCQRIKRYELEALAAKQGWEF